MRRHLPIAAALFMLAILAVGCGGDSDNPASQKQPDETAEITITDGSFEPDQLTFERGTTVEFLFKNEGQADHHALIADSAEQDEHEMMMKEHPDMRHPPGSSGNIIDVPKGERARLVYTFDKPGTFIIGCHKQPDHYTKGERMRIIVN